MNRRNAVKNLVIASGSLITLPFWMEACGVSDSNTHITSFSASEQSTLASITDTIIPAGGSIGALTVGVDKFLQKLIDDCYEPAEQQNIKKQLNALEATATSTFGKSFAEGSQQQRQDALMRFSVSDNKDEKDFFNQMKSETIRGFNTSQKVMEDYLNYTIAPGHYYGCVNVKA